MLRYMLHSISQFLILNSQFLFVIISSTSLSVSSIPLEPIFVRLRILWSTSSSIIPSTEVTQRFSIAMMAERTAVETPVVTFKAQLGLAPSQIIPVMLDAIFRRHLSISDTPPPFIKTSPQAIPLPAAIAQPQNAESRPEYSLMYMQIK